MKTIISKTGHWEYRDQSGGIIMATGEITDTAENVCDSLRKQAVGLMGKAGLKISYTAMIATGHDGATVRFVGTTDCGV